MDEKRKRVLAIAIVIAIPLCLIFIFWPWAKIPRPKAPPRYFPVGVKDTVNEKGQKVSDTTYRVVQNFKFQTQNGDSLELDSMRGSIYVCDFFFATCPGICPRLSNSLERVQNDFLRDEQVKILSFTVDPDKDTMQALRKYAQQHNAVPGKWYFLRGAKQDVYALAANSFNLTAKPDDDGGPEAFMHSEKMVLVDWEGNIRGYYSGIDSSSVKRLMGDIVLLLRQHEDGFSFKKQKQTSKGLFDN